MNECVRTRDEMVHARETVSAIQTLQIRDIYSVRLGRSWVSERLQGGVVPTGERQWHGEAVVDVAVMTTTMSRTTTATRRIVTHSTTHQCSLPTSGVTVTYGQRRSMTETNAHVSRDQPRPTDRLASALQFVELVCRTIRAAATNSRSAAVLQQRVAYEHSWCTRYIVDNSPDAPVPTAQSTR